jgi:hypothetical protein
MSNISAKVKEGKLTDAATLAFTQRTFDSFLASVFE